MFKNKFKKCLNLKNTLNITILDYFFPSLSQVMAGIKAVKDNNTLITRALITQNWNNK